MRILRTPFATDARKTLRILYASQVSQEIRASKNSWAAFRPFLKATTLRRLVNNIRKRHAVPCPVPSPPSEASPPSRVARQLWNNRIALKVIARILQNARAVWPSGLEDIAVLATELIGQGSHRKEDLDIESVQKLSHLYNELLSLLAMPTSLRTFQAVIHQQRAQFILIKQMTTYNPHLPLTREGFRALAVVQLAHRKTEGEREWASSKALSWPPWKEQLLGIDADSEDVGKSSRAIGVLSRMVDAGYSHSEWEKTVRIFAGWDTDNSPTIQTRKFLPKAPEFSTDSLRDGEISTAFDDKGTLWGARISATRTVKEAWACFTSYVQCTSGIHGTEPYNAMFFRLIYAQKDNLERGTGSSSRVPGDGPETWPEPTSPRDFLYVPSDPPSIHEFWGIMRRRRLLPAKLLLSALLDSTDSYVQGESYLLAGNYMEGEKHDLAAKTKRRRRKAIMGIGNASVEDVRIAAERLGNRVTAAWIRLLCRANVSAERRFVLVNLPHPRMTGSTRLSKTTADPFCYAQCLVTALRSPHRPIWHALLGGINRRLAYYRDPEAMNMLTLAWLDHLYDMDSLGIDFDFEGFSLIAETLETITLLGCAIPDTWLLEDSIREDSHLQWTALCKRIFCAMAYGGSLRRQKPMPDPAKWLPLGSDPDSGPLADPIDLPSPAAVHRTIRILGICEDYHAILTLLHWIEEHALRLASAGSELANSRKLYRRSMCAVRYFLETSWRDEDFDCRAVARHDWQPGQREIVEHAKSIIVRRRRDWGGWPTDQDLRAYHEGNKNRARRMRTRLGLANVSFNSHG